MKEHPYFSEIYARNLDVALNHIQKKSLDWFHVIDGPVGSGKSTLAIETCLYLDPTFNVDRVAYSFEEIQQIVQNLGEPPESVGKAILWDEAAEGQYAQDSMKSMNREVAKFFFRVRKKRLFICSVIPYFWKLQDSSRLRTMSLTHCEFSMNEQEGLLEQGHFKFYAYDKLLYILNTKSYPDPTFSGLFKAAPTELWDKVISKNYNYLEETDANAILKVKKINQFELDINIANALKNILGTQPSAVVTSEQVLNILKVKYHEQVWLNPRFIGSKIKGYGFMQYRKLGENAKTSAFIVTIDGLTNLRKELKLDTLLSNATASKNDYDNIVF
jgi:hypothetical protein